MENNDIDILQFNIGALINSKNSFWGYLFSILEKEKNDNLDCPMCVSINKNFRYFLTYNSNMLKSMSNSDIIFVLEHEGMHILNRHVELFYEFFSDTNNIKYHDKMSTAVDLAVNSLINANDYIIVKDKKYFLELPKLYKFPEKKSTEYYFNELNKENSQNKNKFDNHKNWLTIPPDIINDPTFSNKVLNNLKNIILNAKENFTKSKGTLSGELEELIGNILDTSKLSYYEIIKRLIISRKKLKLSKSFNKVSRKKSYLFLDNPHLNNSILPFPGKKYENSFTVCIIIDTSGSMSIESISESFKGISNLLENDINTEIIVIEVDTKVEKVYKCKKISDIQFEVKGRGGTILSPAFDESKNYKPDVILCFTDGYCENFNEINRDKYPSTIWVITENGTDKYVKNFGSVVFIPKK